jgi:urease accessory protein
MSEGGPYRVHGRLRLRFEAEQPSGRTVLAVRDQRSPLQVVRAFETGEDGALVHLHNLSGGVLGGDRLELAVEVGAAARAQLTSTGATRVYRSRPEVADACQSIAVRVEENGVLEYLPDPLIPFAGARYRQDARIDLADGAGLFWWETVTPGRLMRGEVFAYERLCMDLDLRVAGQLVARERFRLEPGVRPLSSPARLGSHRTFATFFICRAGLDAAFWLELEHSLAERARELSRPGERLWGVSTLPAHGLVVRGLSATGREIASGLLAFWRAAKWELYRQEAVPPRKIY